MVMEYILNERKWIYGGDGVLVQQLLEWSVKDVTGYIDGSHGYDGGDGILIH